MSIEEGAGSASGELPEPALVAPSDVAATADAMVRLVRRAVADIPPRLEQSLTFQPFLGSDQP